MGREENIQKMYNLLITNNGYTTKELMNELKLKDRKTIGGYIEILKEKDIDIIRKEKKYYINESSNYNFLTEDDIRNFMILEELSKKNYTEKELLNYIHDDNDNHIIKPVKKSRLNQIIHSLIKQNDLEKRNHILIPTGTNYPLAYSLSENEIENLYYKLLLIANTHPFYKDLMSIRDKIAQMYDYNSNIDDCFVSYGHSKVAFSNENNINIIKEILKKNYRNHVLNIQMKNLKKNTTSKDIGIGLIFFSIDKDKYYIIGKDMNNKKTTLIDISKISQIKEEETLHYEFQSHFYLDTLNHMMGVSFEKKTHVIVEFDDIYNIEEKLRRFQKMYNNIFSITHIQNDKLKLEGDIIGMSEFAKYLREFGYGCRVIEPKELKEKLLFSVKRSLVRYGVEYE